MDDPTDLNREHWEEAAAVHPDTAFYDVEHVVEGGSSLRPLEREELSDVVDGETDLLHPMCHFGLDTVSWARRCRSAVGVDFSETAVERAQELAREAGVENVAFHVGEVTEFDLDRRFDVVVTTYGVLGWLPDLHAWADNLAAHLRPGGRLYLAEIHPGTGPFHDVTADGATFGEWSHPYFRGGPLWVDADGTYADQEATLDHTETVQYQHTLGEVVSALAGPGLRLEFLREHPWSCFRMYPEMTEDDAGRWWLPEVVPVDLPLTFSVRLQKPR